MGELYLQRLCHKIVSKSETVAETCVTPYNRATNKAHVKTFCLEILRHKLKLLLKPWLERTIL